MDRLQEYHNVMIDAGFAETTAYKDTKHIQKYLDEFGYQLKMEMIAKNLDKQITGEKFNAIVRFSKWYLNGEAPKRMGQKIGSMGYLRPSLCVKICEYNFNGKCAYNLDEFIKKAFVPFSCPYRKEPKPQEKKSVKGNAVIYQDSHSVMYGKGCGKRSFWR